MKKVKLYLSLAVLISTFNSCTINGISGQANIVIDQTENTFENVASLVVKGSFCNVNITSHGSDNVAFRGEVKANETRDDIKIKYQQNGSALEVWIERPNSLRGSFNGLLEFKVPVNTHVDVDNSSGSIYVGNIGQSIIKLAASSGSIEAEHINSDLNTKTSSGSIKVHDISGSVSCTSSSGSQSITKVGAEVNAQSSSGRIGIEGAQGNIKSKSSSGSQQLGHINGNVNSIASSGSLRISDVHGDVTAETSSGSIKLNNIKGALQLTSSSGGQNGEGILLTANSSFKSSSGSIKMELTNASEDLSFDLRASSGSLNAKGTSGKKNLQMDKGGILIKGVSTAGSQNYY